jgi:hypothetical protein
MANVKINTTNTVGGYPEPVNPNTTGALAGGFYPQNSSSNDGNAGIERDSSNNLTVKSAASVNINGSTTSADAVVVAASTSGAALRVTQTGSGNAILVEDAANPDSTAFVVDSVGNVGVRTTLPSYDLDVLGDNSAAIAITAAGAAPTDASVNIGINDTTGDNYVRFGDGANYEQGRIRYNHDSDFMSFSTSQTEALRIDSTQQVAVGGGAPISAFSVSKDGFATATFRGNGVSAGGYARYIRARGTVASPTIVNNGDYIGGVLFGGYDGSTYRDNAAMYGIVGGAPGASDMPGALAFSTAADGTVTLTERMRIDAAGNVGIGTTSPTAALHSVAGSTTTPSLTWNAAAGQTLRNENSELAVGLSSVSPFPLYLQGRTSTSTARDLVLEPAGGNVGIGIAPVSGIKLHVASDTNNWIRSQAANGIPLLNCNRSNGTNASPTAVVLNDELGRFDVRGYNNGDFRQAAQIAVSCTAAPGASDTAIGSAIAFSTSPGGTTAPATRMYIDKDGNVGVGTTSTLGNAKFSANSGVVARTEAASGTTPYLQTYNGNASTDLKTWRMGGNSSGAFVVETVNDAYTTAVGRITLTNAGVLTNAGQIESSSNGFKFPDATTQTTSSGLISRLTSAVTTTSTTFTDITGLTTAVAATTTYFFEAYLIWQQNNTSGGIGFAVNGPGGTGQFVDYTIQYQNFANDAAGTIQTVHTRSYDTGYTIPTTTTAANTSYVARISGVLVTGIAAPGTLALRFKSNNASYTASIQAGSWLLLRRGNT